MSERALVGPWAPITLLKETSLSRVLCVGHAKTRRRGIMKASVAGGPLLQKSSAFADAASDCFGPGAPVDLVRHETDVLTSLSHGAIPAVLDQGEHNGLPWLVLEPRSGETLRSHIGRGRLAPEDVYEVAVQVLDALAHVHAHGVMHRDIHPGNIILDRGSGRVSLIDFALATRGGVGVGGLVGSAAYRAPEATAAQISELVLVDERADLYALGVVLFEALTGRLPPRDATEADASRPSELWSDLAAGLERLIRALLARQPGDRPASASAALSLLSSGRAWMREPAVAAARAGVWGLRPSMPAFDMLADAGWLDVATSELSLERMRSVVSVALELSSATRPGRLEDAERALRLGRLDDAWLAAAQVAQEAAPGTGPWLDGLRIRGHVELALARNDDALGTAHEGLRAAPEHAFMLALQGCAVAALGGGEEATLLLSLACEAQPSLGPRSLARVAEAALRIGDPGLAIAAALRALETATWPYGAVAAEDRLDERGGSRVLASVVGQVALLAGRRVNDSAVLMPLSVGCVALAVADLMSDEPDPERAARWFLRAVEAGNAARATHSRLPSSFLELVALAYWGIGDAARGDAVRERAHREQGRARTGTRLENAIAALAQAGQLTLAERVRQAPAGLVARIAALAAA